MGNGKTKTFFLMKIILSSFSVFLGAIQRKLNNTVHARLVWHHYSFIWLRFLFNYIGTASITISYKSIMLAGLFCSVNILCYSIVLPFMWNIILCICDNVKKCRLFYNHPLIHGLLLIFYVTLVFSFFFLVLLVYILLSYLFIFH